MTDGLGKTNGGGKNTLEGMSQVMALSGDTLPQISSNGGTLSGTFHIVTTDGAGPLQAVLDPTGTGAFSQGTMLETVTQVPGKGGNIKATQGLNSPRGLWSRMTNTNSPARSFASLANNLNSPWPSLSPLAPSALVP
jgi:hypothetical protein